MSAIGDYIHLTYGGYVKKTGRHEGPYKDSAQDAIQRHELMYNAWVKSQEKGAKVRLEKQIQKNLNILKNMKNKSGKAASYEGYEQELLENIARILPEKYIRFDLVEAAAAGLIERSGAMTGSRNIAGAGTEKQKSSFMRIKNQIQNYLNNFTDNFYNDLNNIEDLKDYNELNDYLNKINNTTTSFLEKLSILTNGSKSIIEFKEYCSNLDLILKEIQKNMQNNDLNINLLQQLQVLIKTLTGGLDGTAAIGDMGEAISNISGEQLGKIGRAAIEQVVTEGSKSSDRGYDLSNFSSRINFNEEKTNFQQIGNFLITSKAKQDKVDVSIELKNNQEINLSIKNYSEKSLLSSGIHFEAASLLELLQNENDDNFINHYLNLNAIHGLQNSADKRNINILLKKIIAAKLIAGYHYATAEGAMKEANYFVVIDHTNYKVKVYSMKDIFEKIINQGKYEKVHLPTNLMSNNKWQENISTRLTNVTKVLAMNSGSLSLYKTELEK